MVNLRCLFFGHKYEKQILDPQSRLYLMICKRCGHNRDLHPSPKYKKEKKENYE